LRPFIGLLALIGVVILYKEIAVLGICLAYIFFGLFRHLQHRRPKIASKPTAN
jgi:CDP-diacylglycerol--serine O-phosphatidyltransferase